MHHVHYVVCSLCKRKRMKGTFKTRDVCACIARNGRSVVCVCACVWRQQACVTFHRHAAAAAYLEALVLQHLLNRNDLAGLDHSGLIHHTEGTIADDL